MESVQPWDFRCICPQVRFFRDFGGLSSVERTSDVGGDEISMLPLSLVAGLITDVADARRWDFECWNNDRSTHLPNSCQKVWIHSWR